MTGGGPLKVGVLSVTPSPYQRDLFAALAKRPEWNLRVFYQEDRPPDSPWPWEPLADYERVLPGVAPGWPTLRSHINWDLPNREAFDLWITNTALTSWTGQRLMRQLMAEERPWIFWGERLRHQVHPLKHRVQESLLAPLASASGIAAIGQWAQQDYLQRFPEVPVEDLPYAPDVSAFAAARVRVDSAADQAACTFLFCGQMIARKGVDVLLQAFYQVAEEFPQARLLLLGRQDEATELGANLPEGDWRKRVESVGFVGPQDLPAHFARADVFVLPSRHDGWGVVVHQAAAAGLPVIASEAVGSVRNLVVAGTSGMMVRAGEVKPLAEAMMTLAADKGLRERMGEESQQLGLALTPEKEAQKWVAFAERVAKA